MEEEIIRLKKELKQAQDEIKRLRNTLSVLSLPSDIGEMSVEVDKEYEENSGSNSKDTFSGIHNRSSKDEKIKLFLSYFKGREDVCAKRWKNKPGYSPYCRNDFKQGICLKPLVKCIQCQNQDFIILNQETVEEHLMGKEVIGLYPMTENDTCYLLAMDFDEERYKEEAEAVINVSEKLGIFPLLERSRSGQGCHLWFFFEQETKSVVARKFGMTILSLAMEESRSITFSSFDRMFPSQDFLETGGFGNLIALPLQKEARKYGNTEFLDKNFDVIKDPWAHLFHTAKINKSMMDRVLENEITSPKEMAKSDNDLSGRVNQKKLKTTDFPETLILEKDSGILMSKENISLRGLLYLRSLASYHNPEFFQQQAMRRTTFGIPRISEIYQEDLNTIRLPRGCEEELCHSLKELGVKHEIKDHRSTGSVLNVDFRGNLRIQQQEAVIALKEKENGVLSATTGFGKTVIGAALISERKCSTLILVHTKDLAEQWKSRLEEFLEFQEGPFALQGLKKKKGFIGVFGGGKKALTGKLDIALMQSMFNPDQSVKDIVNDYGMVIVDECHHVSAKNFMRILQSAEAKYVYGLTATPVRKDGHHPIIFMHCGPIRYRVNPKKEAINRGFRHVILPRFTNLQLPPIKHSKDWHITEIYGLITENDLRNNLIVEDVEKAFRSGRTPLVLSARIDHVERLKELLEEKNLPVKVLTGQMKNSERKSTVKELEDKKPEESFILLATGKLIGEGFDLPKLDTLFLSMPVSWKGTITQYAGRLHREYHEKQEVQIYDYVDLFIPVLEGMYKKRMMAYKSIGYSMVVENHNELSSSIYDVNSFENAFIQDIRTATKSIVLSGRYVQYERIEPLVEHLEEAMIRGVRISLITRPIEDYKAPMRQAIQKKINELIDRGILIIEKSENHLQVAVLDEEYVWYGSLPILETIVEEGMLIRVQDKALAEEIFSKMNQDERK